MDVCRILLGQPWQYDTQAIHKGCDNTYEFSWMGKTVVLLPLTGPSVTKHKEKGQQFHLSSGKQLLFPKYTSILGLVIKDFNPTGTTLLLDIPPEVTNLLDPDH